MFFHTTLMFTITVSTERHCKLILFLTHKYLQIARLLHPPPLLVEGVRCEHESASLLLLWPPLHLQRFLNDLVPRRVCVWKSSVLTLAPGLVQQCWRV